MPDTPAGTRLIDAAIRRGHGRSTEGTDPMTAPEITDGMVEAAAIAIHAKFVAQRTRPEDWPTWRELLAQGHQGAHRVRETRELARAALTAALARTAAPDADEPRGEMEV